ncbi:NAD(P)/FAD-dependent oxidoreductase [Xanthomonas sp. SS]|uniref:FAD-dependent monooxygenase n=1 Tax=Xanthomonas sp. SS TaxID=2724122 RepID=UPI001860E919|nr:FAD-dependent monooxygenase [Xanthomonas sp. SS]QNH16145.1 NAD(P)/FAD-dependent oxidoreductase [Xanthomonas sp. SS]
MAARTLASGCAASDRHAVAIVGGGAAGCATALALAAHGIEDAVVIDLGRAPGWRLGEAMPPTSAAVLQRLGVWDAFRAQAPLPSAGSCASWGKPELGYNDFIVAGQGKGWHVDRSAFDAMLAAAVPARGGTSLRGLRLCGIGRCEDGGYLLELRGEDGRRRQLAAGFLVDASGIAAAAVRRLGVARNEVDCLGFVAAMVALQRPEAIPSQALLEACHDGWWYAAKLPGKRMVVALAVEPARQRHYRDAAVWLAAAKDTQHVARWLQQGEATLPDNGGLLAALAPAAILSRVVGERWLAVGDAASAYDPLAAQGIVKALQDGEAAGQALAQHLHGAGPAALASYQDRVFARFTEHLRVRRSLYARERRWPQSPFWQARLSR